VRDTGESSEDEKTGKSEKLVETKVVSTSRNLTVMWTEASNGIKCSIKKLKVKCHAFHTVGKNMAILCLYPRSLK
jgi:enhancing lycopene biosynthesis protein 2